MQVIINRFSRSSPSYTRPLLAAFDDGEETRLCALYCTLCATWTLEVHWGRAACLLFSFPRCFVVSLFQDVESVELYLYQTPQQAVATSKPVVNHHCYRASFPLYNVTDPPVSPNSCGDLLTAKVGLVPIEIIGTYMLIPAKILPVPLSMETINYNTSSQCTERGKKEK